jgi:hypothetical protein
MKICEEDLKLIGGDLSVDASSKWLFRYFKTDLSSKFLTYYLTFKEVKKRVSLRCFCQLFIDHTGCYGSINTFCKFAKKICDLEEALNKAEKSRDLDLLSKIKLGEFDT